VAVDVNLSDAVVQNLSALFEKIIDCPGDYAFIPRYRGSGNRHGIARNNMQLFMVAVGNTHQR